MNFFKSKYFFDSSIALLKNKWLPFVLGIPLFFCLHRYEGIVIDAVLYLLQVIYSISPERFINDPPFMFGNQDSLGFFTPLYKLFLDFFSIADGTKYACFFFQLIWITSLIYLVKKIGILFKNRLWILPITIIFIGMCADKMPHFRMLFVNFVENYNCSRLLSVAFGIAGLALLFSKRKWFSLAVFLVGTFIHPLSAGWGIPVWFWVYYPKTKYAIIFFSALIPLSFLLHTGSFDVLPDDYLKRPLLYAPKIWDVFRILVYCVFLYFFVPRKTSGFLVHISRAISLILLISCYWNLWGSFGKHFLLYQLQTWRAEWLAWAVITPFYFNILFGEVRKRKNLFLFMQSRSCFVLEMFFLALFIPLNIPFFLVVAIIVESNIIRLHLKKIIEKYIRKSNGKTYIYLLASILVLWSVFSGVYADAVLLALDGSVTAIFLSGDFQVADSLIRSNTMVCLLLSTFFAVYSFFQKRWLSVACFFAYVFFPFLFLLPILGLVPLFLDYKKSNVKFLFISIFLIGVVDGLLATDLRCQFFFDVFSISFKPVLFWWGYVFLLLMLWISVKREFLKKMLFLFLLLPLASYALCFWDGRSIEKKHAEESLEFFKNETIFSYVKDRGRMFYYVTGNLVDMPRLQFLTGAYLSYNTHMGEIFFKEQFFEAQKRDNYLFYKDQKCKAHEKSEYRTFVTTILSNRDSLVDRINYLCRANEISYLVSNLKGLPYYVHDSMYVDSIERGLFLYQCPGL